MPSAFGVERTKPWLVAVPEDFPPHYQLDARGKPVGFAIDVMDELARHTGRPVVYIVKPNWSETFEALHTGQVDLIPNVGISDSRLKDFAFSTPVETVSLSVFVRSTELNIRTSQDLTGRIVGAIGANVGSSFFADRKDIEIRIFDHPAKALVALLSGQVDAVVYPEAALIAEAKRAELEHNIRKLDESLLEIKRAIAVQRSRAELIKELNPAIDALLKSPQFTRIYSKWYGKSTGFWTTRLLLTTLGISLALAGLLFFIIRFILLHNLNRQLRQQINERQRAEHELLDSEARYRQLVETALEGILVCDAMGNIVFVNDSMSKMLGSTRDEMVGKSGFSVVHQSEMDKAVAYFESMKNLESSQIEIVLAHRNGSQVFCTTTLTPLVRDGKFDGSMAMVTDITARRHAEAERQKLQTALQQTQKMEAIGRLAGGIAHDFNNILQGIFTSVELAQRQAVPPETQRLLSQTRDFGDRGRDLVRQIMTFSRRETTDVVPVDLITIVQDVLKLVRAIVPTTVAIETNFDEPTALVLGNVTQLQQVIINLCTNAVQAMPDRQGTITIDLSRVAGDQRWLLTIADDGAGIPMHVMSHIFEPFFTTKPSGEGTGLGLSVAHGIVTAHNGHISASANAEGGTTFSISLPICMTTALATASRKKEPRPVKSGHGRIMIVDDERMIIELCRETLVSQGYEVEAFQDGGMALKRLIRRDAPAIDLIVTDNAMPGMSGLQLAEAVRKIENAPPVVLISGFLDETELQRSRALVVEFLYKPVQIDELRGAVARALDA